MTQVRAVHRTERMKVDIYVWDDDLRRGVRQARVPTGIVEVAPGAEMPALVSLDTEVYEALIEEQRRETQSNLERADKATEDAREVRDRLLTMVERLA